MPGALAFATAILIHHMCISSSHIHTHSPGFQNKPKYYWPISKAGKMIIVTSRWHCATSSHMHTTVCHKTLAYLKYAWIDALSFCKFVFPFQYNPGVCFPFNINLEPQQVIYISIVKVIWTDFYSSFLLCIILLYYTFYYVWKKNRLCNNFWPVKFDQHEDYKVVVVSFSPRLFESAGISTLWTCTYFIYDPGASDFWLSIILKIAE